MRAAISALALLTLAGCAEARFESVHSGLEEGLLSVWGRSATDVWAVGSDAGQGPAVLRFDGANWSRLDTGERGDLWWVHGSPDSVWLGGAGGLILRYRDGAFERHDTPGNGTVFGLWAAAEDDVWAVGGAGGSAGFVWRWDGTEWRALELEGLADRAVFKVWGRGADDVWVVGAAGLLGHYDGAGMEWLDAGTTRTLFTIHLRAGEAAAVGGAGDAVLVEGRDGAFTNVAPEFTPQLSGIWLEADGGGWAAGLNGTILRRVEGRWQVEPTDHLDFVQALHAIWVDDEGGVWAVGGQVVAFPFSDGALWYRGDRVVATGRIE